MFLRHENYKTPRECGGGRRNHHTQLLAIYFAYLVVPASDGGNHQIRKIGEF